MSYQQDDQSLPRQSAREDRKRGGPVYVPVEYEPVSLDRSGENVSTEHSSILPPEDFELDNNQGWCARFFSRCCEKSKNKTYNHIMRSEYESDKTDENCCSKGCCPDTEDDSKSHETSGYDF